MKSENNSVHQEGKLLSEYKFQLSKELSILTQHFSNGEKITQNTGVYINQKVILHGNNSTVKIELFLNEINSDSLRKLADELDYQRYKLIEVDK